MKTAETKAALRMMRHLLRLQRTSEGEASGNGEVLAVATVDGNITKGTVWGDDEVMAGAAACVSETSELDAIDVSAFLLSWPRRPCQSALK